MALDLAAILSLLLGEQKREKRKAETGKGDGQDALHDAFIDAILPELSSYFLTLFEEKDAPTLLRSLNAFILTVYQASPDALQFLIRLMANVSVEKWQDRAKRRNIPAWALTAPMVFIKAYFGALEDMASKNKAQGKQTTPEDIKAALNNFAKKAKQTGSDLNTKLGAAQKAARDFASSHKTTTEGPDMGNPHANPKPPPSAGGAGGGSPPPPNNPKPAQKDGDDKKGSIGELVDTVKDVFTALSAIVAWWGDRGEDHIQEGARALFWVPVALLVTAAFTFVAAISPRDEPMMVVTAAAAIFWTLGPFAAYWIWRRNASLEAEKNEENPAERPGNGVIELGMLAVTGGFVGSISMLTITAVCVVGSFSSGFHPLYYWISMIAMAAVFVTCMATDMLTDSLKSIGGLAIPRLRSETLPNRVTRSFSLFGLVFGLAMAVPVLAYTFGLTDYVGSKVALGLFLGIVAGFLNTRVANAPNHPPFTPLLEQFNRNVLRDYKTSRSILFAGIIPIVFFTLFDLFAPPRCPTDPELAPSECPVELPTYAERWHDSDIREIGGRAYHAVVGLFLDDEEGDEDDSSTALMTVVPADNDTCSARVEVFVAGIATDDCKVILKAGTDADLIALCDQARDCGALAPNGRKVVQVVREKKEWTVADVDDWGVGEVVLAGFALVGVLFLVILILAALGGGEEKKDGHSKGH
jgi:hypothetical protein